MNLVGGTSVSYRICYDAESAAKFKAARDLSVMTALKT